MGEAAIEEDVAVKFRVGRAPGGGQNRLSRLPVEKISGWGARFRRLATYGSMAFVFDSPLASRSIGVGRGIPANECPVRDAAAILQLLESGRIDEGMRAACLYLAERREAHAEGDSLRLDPAPAGQALLLRLRENPFLRAALAPAYGYEGDPVVLDLALGVAPMPADTTPLGLAMYRWMAGYSTTFAAWRARRQYLADCLDRAADRHPGAPVVGLFAGHGRELPVSRAWREARVAVQLIDFDTRVMERALRSNAAWGSLTTRPGTLAEMLSGRMPLSGCGMIYAPFVAEHLPDNTLAQLLAVLVPALRPGGEIVIPAFTRLPEPGLLELAADWQPNTRSLSGLKRLARDIDEAKAELHDEPALGIAFLHLRRQIADKPLCEGTGPALPQPA